MRFLPALLALVGPAILAQAPAWNFAVSGDSRNCGDVVMPAIARGAITHRASFYWHLGDYRAISLFDQDYAQLHQSEAAGQHLLISAYLADAWQDFIVHQLQPFGKLPVYLAFGNHELVPPKTRKDLIAQFADWLDAPPIRAQREHDDPLDHRVRGYYHWVQDGIDFITLDNASPDEFDGAQLAWVQKVLRRDADEPEIRAVVAGMHEALPESLAMDHSMEQSPTGIESGRKVYEWLLDLKKKTGKPVYILASHSHYYMEDTFNTEYWRTHGGVLPGWIIGTAGAERYALPPDAKYAKAAKTNVYGYLIAAVTGSRTDPIHFEFEQLGESDVPTDVMNRFTPEFVHSCWTGNSRAH